jgi:hypothetical protein
MSILAVSVTTQVVLYGQKLFLNALKPGLKRRFKWSGDLKSKRMKRVPNLRGEFHQASDLALHYADEW